jgi:hypothetical protein
VIDAVSNSNSNSEFVKEIKSVFSTYGNWQSFRSRVDSLKSGASEEQARYLLASKKNYNDALLGSHRWSSYYAKDFVFSLLKKYPTIGDSALLTGPEPVRLICLSNGFYSDIKVLDKLAKSGTINERRIAAKGCSIKVLRSLKKDKDKVVRKTVFERLGPAECLDDMLADKMAEIRAMGAEAAPFGYEKLSEIIMKEIAKRPFSIMVTKVPLDFLPLVLANRNLKSKWVAKLVQQRMEAS